MPSLPFGRILLLLSLATVSAAASALDLNLESTGKAVELTSVGTDEYLLSADQTTFVTQSLESDLPKFADAYLGLTRLDGKTEATLAYRDEQSMNTLNLRLDVESDATENGVRTIRGTWHYASGKGAYAEYSTDASKGQWTFRWTLADGTSDMDMQGSIRADEPTPVPTTASLAALGLVVPIRRRHKRR